MRAAEPAIVAEECQVAPLYFVLEYIWEKEIHKFVFQAPGLGRDLIREIQELAEHTAANPYIESEIRPDLRRRALRRFPFYALYTVEENGVLVVAVAHHRRTPGYWRNRV